MNQPTLSVSLLERLVCPITKGHLRFDSNRNELISTSSRLAYPIENGVPLLVEERGRELSFAEYEYWTKK